MFLHAIMTYTYPTSSETFYTPSQKPYQVSSSVHASDLGLPATNQNWPEAFGFRLGGTGPSYILSVVEGSSAFLAGLQPGDQVVDIEGQDVTNLSTPALIALAQTLRTVPPSIGVVSRIEQVSRRLIIYILQ